MKLVVCRMVAIAIYLSIGLWLIGSVFDWESTLSVLREESNLSVEGIGKILISAAIILTPLVAYKDTGPDTLIGMRPANIPLEPIAILLMIETMHLLFVCARCIIIAVVFWPAVLYLFFLLSSACFPPEFSDHSY